MQKILSAEEMREVDRLTTEKYGIPSIILMENAAHAAANVIKEKLGGSVAGKSFLILCGKGNNGGDGAALARILAIKGVWVDLVLFAKIEETKGDARTNFEICQNLANYENEIIETHHPDIFRHSKLYESDGAISFFEVNSRKEFDELLYNEFDQKWDCVVDAVFGTGLNKPIEGWLSEVVHHINILNDTQIHYFNHQRFLVSIDVPSGLNADLAEQIGGNSRSDLTITFTAPKLANVFPPASNFNGELVVANIGSPQELIDLSPSQTFLAEKSDAQNWISKTEVQKDSYKKTRGTALIIAGSENYSGAAVLAANACFAAGAGMVSLFVPKSIKEIVASKTSDEIIVKTLEDVKAADEKVDVVALGCGLASGEKTREFVRETVENRNAPMVLDAEALNSLAPFDLNGSAELPLILTPHIGEFARLLGREISENKIEEVREFAAKHNVILVLKGERSLIAAPDGKVVINPTGNAGISRAGAGDTLTGIITAFLAQTFGKEKPSLENTFEGVVAALYIAGSAGDIAAEKFSQRLMSASDIRDCLQTAIEKLSADKHR